MHTQSTARPINGPLHGVMVAVAEGAAVADDVAVAENVAVVRSTVGTFMQLDRSKRP
ncbi:hypothetical protein [Halorubrum lacusprofundi]|jgi:hypothetical protein|nr:hypothetical protein [Halorubrum lacusprofundi]MCG1007110.1 hypothetical protein [Halorubrum lacusprofundi]